MYIVFLTFPGYNKYYYKTIGENWFEAQRRAPYKAIYYNSIKECNNYITNSYQELMNYDRFRGCRIKETIWLIVHESQIHNVLCD